MSNDDASYSIECEIGALSLEVSGADPDWVEETFREEWSERLDEAGDMTAALRRRGEEFQ